MTDAKKLEIFQKRCIRYVLQDFNSTYQIMLNVLKVPTLYERRLRNVLECVFKVLHNQVPPVENIFTLLDRHYDFRNTDMLHIPHCQTVKFGTKSVRVNGACLWNKLPNYIRSQQTFMDFKKLLNVHEFSCTCNNCPQCSISSL